MATTATTLAGAIKADDWIVQLASATGLKAGDSIVCEQESMRVLVPAFPVPNAAIVYRGARGTAGKTHASAVACTYGGPSDYGAGVGVVLFRAEDETREARIEREKAEKAILDQNEKAHDKAAELAAAAQKAAVEREAATRKEAEAAARKER